MLTSLLPSSSHRFDVIRDRESNPNILVGLDMFPSPLDYDLAVMSFCSINKALDIDLKYKTMISVNSFLIGVSEQPTTTKTKI